MIMVANECVRNATCNKIDSLSESLIGGSRVWMNVTVNAAGGKCSLMPLDDRLIITTSALKKYNDNNNKLKLLYVRTTRRAFYYY